MLRIKEVLKEKGLTQTELADKMGVERITVAKMIVGNPTVNSLKRIADAIGVQVVDLFERDSPKLEETHEDILFAYKDELKRFGSIKELEKFIKTLK